MKHHKLIVLLLLGVLAAASGQQATTTDAGLTLSGTVSNWDMGEAELAIVLFGEGELEESERLATSSIAPDGSFEITVPPSLPEEGLTRGSMFTLCGGGRFDGTVSEPTWREGFTAPLVSQDGEPLGLLTPSSSQDFAGFGPGQAGDFFVGFLYVDRDLTIQGSCARNGHSFVNDYDAALNKGWNQVVLSVDEVTEDGAMVMSARTVATLPEGTHWFYTPAEDLWRAHGP